MSIGSDWSQNDLCQVFQKPVVQLKKHITELFAPIPTRSSCEKIKEIAFRGFVKLPFCLTGYGISTLTSTVQYLCKSKKTKKEIKLVRENTFFQSALFKRITDNLSKREINNCIRVCLILFSFAKNEREEIIIRRIISTLNFKEDHDKAEKLVNLGILFLERIKGAKFNSNPLVFAIELYNRFSYFHGTNLTAFQNISLKGLLREGVPLDHERILEINEIGKRIFSKVWGLNYSKWFPTFIENNSHKATTVKRIYFAGAPGTCISYATRAPEWFWLFFDQFQTPARECPSDGEMPTLKRIEKNVRKLCLPNPDKPELELMTEKEANKVMDFIKHYWKLFSHPAIVILNIKNPDYHHRRLLKTKGKDFNTESLLKLIATFNKIPFDNSPDNLGKILIETFKFFIKGAINESEDDRDFSPEMLTSFRINLPTDYFLAESGKTIS